MVNEAACLYLHMQIRFEFTKYVPFAAVLPQIDILCVTGKYVANLTINLTIKYKTDDKQI